MTAPRSSPSAHSGRAGSVAICPAKIARHAQGSILRLLPFTATTIDLIDRCSSENDRMFQHVSRTNDSRRLSDLDQWPEQPSNNSFATPSSPDPRWRRHEYEPATKGIEGRSAVRRYSDAAPEVGRPRQISAPTRRLTIASQKYRRGSGIWRPPISQSSGQRITQPQATICIFTAEAVVAACTG